MIESPEQTRPSLVPLLAILALGLSLRLLWFQTPLIDGHRWRQVDTAAIARNLYRGSFDVFHPEVDWGGRAGFVESEFPLVPALAAALYHLFGQHDYFGRLISVAFSTGSIALTFALAAEFVGAAGGLAAAFLVAVSPASVFFGRTFMPDSAMVFFWLSGVLGFVRYFRTDEGRWLWLGGGAATLACLTKIPAVMMFAPIAAAAWRARGRGVIRDRAFLAAAIAPGLVTAAWYVHAYLLYRQSGLTFGVLAHPAKTYPIWVAPGPWKYAFSKYSTVALLTTPDFYRQMAGRLHHFLLLPWGLAGALVGAIVWPREAGRGVADAWLAAMVAFVLVMGEANISHEYYQLPIVPLGALYFGAAAGSLFDGSWAIDKVKGLAKAVVLLLVGAAGFYYSGVIVSHFRPGNLDVRIMDAGEAVGRAVPDEALIIVVDDYGVTSPMLLYFAQRKGWSFGSEDVYPQVIDGLKRRGARYFATTVWPAIERDQPDTAAYLKLYPRVPTTGGPGDVVVFDIGAGLVDSR